VIALNTVTDRLAERTGYRGRNGSWRCPAHDDRHPSLSVSNGDGKVLLHCHAGCELADILTALGLEQRDLFDQPRQNGHRRILRTHDYVDEVGTRLYQTVRFEGTGDDRFRQRPPRR
jgi:putative DNA primase/helicase